MRENLVSSNFGSSEAQPHSQPQLAQAMSAPRPYESLAEVTATRPINLDFLHQKIGAQLRTLGCLDTDLILPELDHSVIATLSDKKILMVDDKARSLALWVPSLLLATTGAAEFLQHREEMGYEHLIAAIYQQQPDVILLDYNLAGDLIKGTHVLRNLAEYLPQTIFLGLSGSHNGNTKLLEAGAVAAYDKFDSNQNKILSEVADIVQLQAKTSLAIKE